VNANTIVAIAGLIATTLTGLGVTFIQGRIAARNAVAGRLHEQRLSAYTDAMVHVQTVEGSLNEILEDPDLRSSPYGPEGPHRDLITARLRLIAPPSVIHAWQELTSAWDALMWNAEQDGPVNRRGDYHLQGEDADVVRVQAAITGLITALHRAMDFPP
jgi:hypothetical protein